VISPIDWLRRRRLQEALVGYPVYDPPHRREERLLSREQAIENLDYFLRVRHERLARFQDWLRQRFGVALTLDRQGVVALNRWGNKYAGLLIPGGPERASYFTYEPRWVGDHAIYNVIFDAGIAFGEAIIAACPKLHWAVDPTWRLRPDHSKRLKREPGMSFQRPEITGCDNPAWSQPVLHNVFGFAVLMRQPHNRARCRLQDGGAFFEINRNLLVSRYGSILSSYPAGDPDGLLKQMSMGDYPRLLEAEDQANGDEDD
jgi:hypothetical protein